MSVEPRAVDRVRVGLFTATGLAVPFYAFPPVHLLGKAVDLATLIGAAFLAAIAFGTPARRPPRAAFFLVGAGLAIPLLAILPPRHGWFAFRPFLFSYGHWAFVLLFFFGASLLELPESGRRFVVRANLLLASAVAAFGIYQLIGLPRKWPGTGERLLAMQREGFRFMSLGNYMRPTSIFLEPAWLGGYLVWTLALALSIAATHPRGRARLAWLGSALLLGTTAALTVSFGAYADAAALFAVFVVVVVRSKLWSRREAARAAAVVCLAVFLLALSPPGRSFGAALKHRFQNLGERPSALWDTNQSLHESFWPRVRNVELTLAVFLSRPLTGIGVGEFPSYLEKAQIDPNEHFDFPVCGWLALAAEMGILGPLYLAGLLLLVWGRARGNPMETFSGIAVPALLAIALTQQLHMSSFIDLWWWYPVSLAAVLARPIASGDTLADLRYRS